MVWRTLVPTPTLLSPRRQRLAESRQARATTCQRTCWPMKNTREQDEGEREPQNRSTNNQSSSTHGTIYFETATVSGVSNIYLQRHKYLFWLFIIGELLFFLIIQFNYGKYLFVLHNVCVLFVLCLLVLYIFYVDEPNCKKCGYCTLLKW